ncbi:MAG: hypothetical protein ACXABD_11155 [Candidatus Thorarchaeota archaeon]
MAGILSPQLSEIGPAPGGVSHRPDTSTGDLLSNVGSVLDTVSRSFQSLSSSGPTQKDRDNATLQPFAAKIARLEGQREQLGESRFNSMLNAEFKSFAVNNPILTPQARTNVQDITGVSVGDEEFNVVNEQQDAVVSFLDTSRGQLALFSVVGKAKNPETGEFDPDTAFVLLAREAALAASDSAELDAINLQTQKMQGVDTQRELFLKEVVDKKNLDFGDKAQRTVSGFVQAAIDSGAKLDNAPAMLAGLRQNRTALELEILADARQGGFQNHPDFDINDALAPYDSMISMIENLGTDAVAAFETMQAMDSIEVAKVINDITKIPLGSNRDYVNYFSQELLDLDTSNLSIGALGLDATALREAARGVSLFPGTAIPVTPTSGPVPESHTTDEATLAARSLTEDERKNEVRVNIATFGSYVSSHTGGENFRATAVESFGMAAAAINTSATPLAVGTFDKVYDAKFFNTYKTITDFGDSTGANLQSAVTANLATVFEQRLGLANVQITNNFSEAFPEMGLTFQGGKVSVDLGIKKGTASKFLSQSLKRHSLPNDLSGLRRLAILEPNNPAFLPFSEARGITSVVNEVAYLNKIVGVVKRLPDLAPHLMPRIEAAISGSSSAGAPIVNSRKERDALEDGAIYFWIDSDGVRHQEVKGQE